MAPTASPARYLVEIYAAADWVLHRILPISALRFLMDREIGRMPAAREYLDHLFTAVEQAAGR